MRLAARADLGPAALCVAALAGADADDAHALAGATLLAEGLQALIAIHAALTAK